MIWAPPVWTRHTALLLMLFSLILLGAYGLKKSHIAVAVHHPMLWAVVLWSVAHLLANGSAADVVLFGAFLAWALLDLSSNYAPRPGEGGRLSRAELGRDDRRDRRRRGRFGRSLLGGPASLAVRRCRRSRCCRAIASERPT